MSSLGTTLSQLLRRQRRVLLLGIGFALLVVGTLPGPILAAPDIGDSSPTNATVVEAPEHASTTAPQQQPASATGARETLPEQTDPDTRQGDAGSPSTQPAQADNRAENSSTATSTTPSTASATTPAANESGATSPNAGIAATTTVGATGNLTGATVSMDAAVHLDVTGPFSVPHPGNRQRARTPDTTSGDSTPGLGETSERLSSQPLTGDRGANRSEASNPATGHSSGILGLGLGSSAPVSVPGVLGFGGLVGAGAFVIASRRVNAEVKSLLIRKTLGTSLPRLLADWLGRFRPALGLAGYQRYADDDPLAHPTRATIYEQIQANPGIYLSALAEATATPLGTVRHHLKILEFEGLVTQTDSNGRRRYSPIDVEPDVIETLLEDSAARAVLVELVDGPAPVGELAARVDRDPSTITHHTTRLADMGLVERERDGRTTRNHLTDEGRAAIRRARTQAHPADEPASPFGAPTD